MTYYCPHCGWRYDPDQRSHGYELVPEHAPLVRGRIDFDAGDCLGSNQNPRNVENAATDRQTLWNGLPQQVVWAEQDALLDDREAIAEGDYRYYRTPGQGGPG